MNTDKHGSKKNIFIFSASLRLCGLILLLAFIAAAQTKDFTRWVDPFIGTGGHGHTFPGAVLPFGMVQLSPDTRGADWDGSSGYHYSDDVIYGFSHTHLSGTGIPDGCDILFMPMIGEPEFFAKEGDKAVNGYASKFSHANEKAEPGYYSVKLDDDGLLAEMTTTARVGFHRYTFPAGADPKILLDLTWRDKTLMSEIHVKGNRIEGYRRSSSWAKDQIIYFSAEFSEPFNAPYWGPDNSGYNGQQSWVDTSIGEHIRVAFPFKLPGNRQIQLKVALSPVSVEGARKNLAAELPGWDFDKVRADAKASWNKELSKIEVSGATDAQMTTFYTALYHTMIHPSLFNDVDGSYRGLDGKIHNINDDGVRVVSPKAKSSPPYEGGVAAASADGAVLSSATNTQDHGSQPRALREPPRPKNGHPSFVRRGAKKTPPEDGTQNPSDNYTVFSLWDTFRAAHPLYTIIEQKRTVDFINTFIRMYEQGGRLPVWELWGNETDTMIGYHAVSVIADAMAKGIKGFDYEKAYEAAKHSAELDHFGLAAYKKRGYISSEDENESVSKTLEYAYDDWCIAQMAGIMGMRYEDQLLHTNKALASDLPEKQYAADIKEFLRRSASYQNLFDPSTGFMRPKKNGGFISLFAPNEVTFNYTEGNAWVYSFFVLQEPFSQVRLRGGKAGFAKKLDELFTTTDKLTGREQPDITGLIGQYAHGNEPSHHIAYLYDLTDEPWKTQMYVRQILDNFYKPNPDGLIGNEDCGQMSAWYVFSASGFYPIPPFGVYFLGTPLFKEVRYHLENGKTFIVRAPNASSENKYIRSVHLNGKRLTRTELTHPEITAGGLLEFDMSPTPIGAAFPPAAYYDANPGFFAPVPIIGDGQRTFQKSLTFSIQTITAGAKIYYTLDGGDPTERSTLYTGPVRIDKTRTVRAIAIDSKGVHSQVAEATYSMVSHDRTVSIASKYSSQYTGGGDEGLIDGIRGTVNFASGEWQGYQGQDFIATVDLQKETQIHSVGAGFLQVARSWIWMPTFVQFEVSDDGVNFQRVVDIKTDVPVTEMDPVKRDYQREIPPTKARFVRAHAYNLGKIPEWHPGAGGNAWIFVDEIIIR